MVSESANLLRDAATGDQRAAARLLPQIYGELRRLAGSLLARRSPGATLQPTSIVHDAFLKLVGAADAKSQTHFRALAAVAVRQVIVDHARHRARLKRGGGHGRVPLRDDVALSGGEDVDSEAVDRALAQLAELDERAAQVVELRFFGGLTETEIAEYLGVSERTVRNDWTMARAWLRTALAEKDGSS